MISELDRDSIRANGMAPLRLADGAWVLNRYQDVKAALHDPRLSSRTYTEPSRAAAPEGVIRQARSRLARLFKPQPTCTAEPLTRLHGRWFIDTDPPIHTRARAAVQAPLNARVKRFRPKIQALAHELVVQARQAGTIELNRALAYQLPMRIIDELLGMPPDAQEQLRELPQRLGGLMNDGLPQTRETLASTLHILAYFEKVIADKRKHRTDDYISDLITVQENGRIDEQELLTTCILMWFAGFDTIHRLILVGTSVLLDNRSQFEWLRQKPSLVSNAVEELLRVVSPAPWVKRLAPTDMEVAGAPMQAGTIHYLHLDAANRDPAHFHDPDHFDILRHTHSHLAFGSGIHACPGARLARYEARSLFQNLAEHAPQLQRIDPAARPELKAVYGDSAAFHVTFE